MPGDNVDVTPQEKGTVASTSLEARDAVKLPTRLRTVPHSKEFSGSRINKDKAEKPAPADNWGKKSLINQGESTHLSGSHTLLSATIAAKTSTFAKEKKN